MSKVKEKCPKCGALRPVRREIVCVTPEEYIAMKQAQYADTEHCRETDGVSCLRRQLAAVTRRAEIAEREIKHIKLQFASQRILCFLDAHREAAAEWEAEHEEVVR